MKKSDRKLVEWLDTLRQDEFEEWVSVAPIKDVNIAFAYYKKRQSDRVEAELKKYEAQAREVIQKAMRK